MSRWSLSAMAAMAATVSVVLAACTTKEPQSTTYFERSISPILTTSCVRTNTGAGCHVADAKGNAFGNLDLSSYASLQKRKDLLVEYGPYGQPALLVKNIDPFQVDVQGYDGVSATITTDIKHSAGSVLDPSATAYETLRRWIQNGATENNTGVPPSTVQRLPCTNVVGTRSDFDLTKDPAAADFATFRDAVNPVFNQQGVACTAGNCHGNQSNSLYLTCGSTPEAMRWNYLSAQEYLAQTPEASELLRRPLAPQQGGAYHEGGAIFASPGDAGYQALENWAAQHGPAVSTRTDPGFEFFAHRVQPILVKKGCMMVQCHSASMFHDYRLHGGSSGSFSLSATRQNYDLSIVQMALESDDPTASRLVRKNLYRPEVCGVQGCDQPQGLTHRGGPLFEDFQNQRATPALCDAPANPTPYDYDNGNLDQIPAFCVVREWLRRERTARNIGPLTGIAYVSRPTGSVKRAQDFDVYAPGADLKIIAASMTNGVVSADKTKITSVTKNCGLDPSTADIRRPQVSWDGAKIAFAARSSATEPLAVYEMNADGSNCGKRTDVDNTPASANGLLIHNFDPTYAPPDGGFTRLVFASTRGNLVPDNYDYDGPQRTPADPSKPNANLYVIEPDATNPAGHMKQLTYLLDMERQPFVATDGRLVFVSEKRAPNFYQLALRRLNLDAGDYHPLYAQRGSIGYPEATQVVELADRDFATIFSAKDQSAAGQLGVFNRSLGVDFTSTNPADYPIDPTVIDPSQPAAPESDFFLHSLRFPDPSNAGKYASPAPLPSSEFMVSYGTGDDLDVYAISSTTGVKRVLFGEPNVAEVDAVAIYPRAARAIFQSSLAEPNGTTQIVPGQANADVHVLDFPVLASLLFQNTPTGRLVDRDLGAFTIYEDLPPTSDVTSAQNAGSFGYQDTFGSAYARRRPLGTIPIMADGSARFSVPGGVPIVLALPDTPLSKQRNLPRTQREAMVFSPGEVVHQSFKAELFGSLCANCHGSLSGKPIDTGLIPDFVTQASATLSRDTPPFNLDKKPSDRGAPVPAPTN